MKIFILIFIFFLQNAISQDNYKFTIMGNNLKNSNIKLPDKSIFNMFESKGAFTDNQGNIGDFEAQGVRKTNNKALSKSVQFIGQYPSINKLFSKIADRGFIS